MNIFFRSKGTAGTARRVNIFSGARRFLGHAALSRGVMYVRGAEASSRLGACTVAIAAAE